jgi:hypothetical protein
MKLIIILRNPIERAYSPWNMERARNTDNLSFWDAIDTESERCNESLPYQHRVFSYIGRGHYLDQLRRIWAHFPREQVLVFKNEDLKKNSNGTLNQVADLLGITQFNKIQDKTRQDKNALSALYISYEYRRKRLP